MVQTVTTVYSFNCKFNLVIITYYHLFGNLFKLWLHYSLGMPHKNQNCIIFNMMKEAIIWQKPAASTCFRFSRPFSILCLLNVCSQYSVHQALLRSRFEINKARNKLRGHDRNSGTIPIFLINKKIV